MGPLHRWEGRNQDGMQNSEKPKGWAKGGLPQPSTIVVARVLLTRGRTTCLLSSAKVALTNMAPSAKPRLLSVSLMQNFQRGRQVCTGQVVISSGTAKTSTFTPHCPAGR